MNDRLTIQGTNYLATEDIDSFDITIDAPDPGIGYFSFDLGDDNFHLSASQAQALAAFINRHSPQ